MKILKVFLIMMALSLGCVGFVMYDYFFPKADNLEQLDIGEIEDVMVYFEEDTQAFETIDLNDYVSTYNSLKPTRSMSIYDRPTCNYYTVIMTFKAGESKRAFLYHYNNEWFLEYAYEGIYKVKDMKLQL